MICKQFLPDLIFRVQAEHSEVVYCEVVLDGSQAEVPFFERLGIVVMKQPLAIDIIFNHIPESNKLDVIYMVRDD